MTGAMAWKWTSPASADAIGPGTVRTDPTRPPARDPARAVRIVSRIPLGRPGLPDHLAGAVGNLASPAVDDLTGPVL